MTNSNSNGIEEKIFISVPYSTFQKLIREAVGEEVRSLIEGLDLKTQSAKEPEIVNLKQLLKLRPSYGCKATIYRKVRGGEIPHIRRNNKLFFNLHKIDAYMMQGEVKTVGDREEEILKARR